MTFIPAFFTVLALGAILPGCATESYRTKVLWSFDGCLEGRFMERVTTYIYNGNAYTWILLPDYSTMIVKVPLDGSKPQMFPLMPGHHTGDDPHRFYTMAADALGYIHVVGDMHSSAMVKHWISKKPEDISEFAYTSEMGSNKQPQGHDVTYPHLFRSPDGVLYHSIRVAKPVWGIGISVLDAETQTWTMLGSDVPSADVSKDNRARHTKGQPLTIWEDNGEGGDFSYTQPHAIVRWDANKRLHVGCCLLNQNTPSAKGAHTGSDVLYAYSDDGGKTFHRGDGTTIQLPIRAEPGPYQADVVYSRHDGPPPWVDLMVGLSFDTKNRPIVKATDHKTGCHTMLLKDGKWIEIAKGAGPASPQSKGEDDEVDADRVEVPRNQLPYEPHHVCKEYFTETGNLVYVAFPERDHAHGDRSNKHGKILLALSTPLNGR